MELYQSQIDLIKKSKLFIKEGLKKKFKVDKYGIFYLCSFGESPGYVLLKSWQQGYKSIILKIKFFFKEIYKISSLGEFILINHLKKKNEFNTIIINWAKSSDFTKDGNYIDKHFGINSKNNKRIVWFLIYLEEEIPKKIGTNIAILKNINNKYNFNFFKILKNIIKKTINKKNFLRHLYYEFSYFSILANTVHDKIGRYLNKNIKRVLMPYEGQPFQNSIFKSVKKFNKNITTIGFVHSFPVGLPTNFLMRDGAPQKLILNSKSQAYCFSKYLDWPRGSLNILPSTRLKKNINHEMGKKLFLPINFNSKERILDYLNELFLFMKFKIPLFEIRNHPSCINSKKHMSLISQINELLDKKKKQIEKSSQNISIFIGSTGSVIEALERGIKVFHICEDPVFESYTKKIWNKIKVKKINNNIYKYDIVSKDQLIRFGQKSNLFNMYLNI